MTPRLGLRRLHRALRRGGCDGGVAWAAICVTVSALVVIPTMTVTMLDDTRRLTPRQRCEEAGCQAARCLVQNATLSPPRSCGKNDAEWCRDMDIIASHNIATLVLSDTEEAAGHFRPWRPLCRERSQDDVRDENLCGEFHKYSVGSAWNCWLHPTDTTDAGLRRIMNWESQDDEDLADAKAKDPPELYIVIAVVGILGLAAIQLCAVTIGIFCFCADEDNVEPFRALEAEQDS